MKRPLGYIRVSRVGGREGDSFQSPSQQRRAVEGWAASKGLSIVEWHEDLDVSGGTRERPGLDAAMASLRSGLGDGIVVAKLDRLSRLGVQDALTLVEEINAAGGSIAALDLGIDPTTPFGELAMTLMLALGRMERRRITDGWRAAQSRATERGVHIGPTPLGYARDDCSILVPIEPAASIVRDAFSAAVTGGVSAAMAVLSDGFPERAWSTTHTRRTLRMRPYLGEVECGGERTANAHEALVSRETWEAAQPGAVKQYRKSERHPLGGIARCGHCDTHMIGSRDRNGAPRLRCTSCNQSISSSEPERVLRQTLALAVESWALRSGEATEGPDLAAELAAAEGERASYASDLTLADSLGPAAFAAGAKARSERIDDIRTRLAQSAREVSRTTVLPAPDVIASASPSELRAIAVAISPDLSLTVRKGGRWAGGRVTCLVNPPPASVSGARDAA